MVGCNAISISWNEFHSYLCHPSDIREFLPGAMDCRQFTYRSSVYGSMGMYLLDNCIVCPFQKEDFSGALNVV